MCEQCTELEQISVSYIQPRKFIHTMLGCIQSINSQAAASSLAFQCIYIVAIVMVYWRGKRVCSSMCECHTDLEQVSLTDSYIQPWKLIYTMLGGVQPTNSRVVPSSLTFQCIYMVLV